MVNTGRPSKDCHLCRSRRCDLERPACKRCIKYGAECPGYREPQDLIFRNATAPVRRQRRAKRSASALDSACASSSSSSSSSSSGSADSPLVQSPVRYSSADFRSPDALTSLASPHNAGEAEDLAQTVARRPSGDFHLPLGIQVSQHWSATSVPMMLHVYSTLGFLQDVYQVTDSDGPLIWAAHLFSRTYVTNLHYPTSMATESRKMAEKELGMYLGKVLSSVSQALQDPERSIRDDVLVTVWVLANYELLLDSIRREQLRSSWLVHARGLYTLLKSRGNAQLHTRAGRRAFWPTFTLVQIQALTETVGMPHESDEWLGIIRSTVQPIEKFALEACVFMSRMSRVQSQIVQILQNQDTAAALEKYDALVGEIVDAGNTISAMSITPSEPGMLDHYMWLLYWASLIKVHSVVQFLINYLTIYDVNQTSQEKYRAQWFSSLYIVRDATDQILRCIPSLLGPLAKLSTTNVQIVFSSLKVVWPLSTIVASTSARPQQKKDAQTALVFIGNEVGVRQALRGNLLHESIPRNILRPNGFGVQEVDG
ncbi:hypothetical protein B0I35DRAFT_475251 [Stachybotrys elegans]|uniref:Zn(2)-C6 fungal-type domain-containing protein n=1 Tax=Stachybotrys elegans TaxID=80388 RepID=A0A8K0T2A4_9HYPO|nr:hypothetical protein B0I35DRAFT_475251 [Stachybotrys elegans]